jgi:hypothetical protein
MNWERREKKRGKVHKKPLIQFNDDWAIAIEILKKKPL